MIGVYEESSDLSTLEFYTAPGKRAYFPDRYINPYADHPLNEKEINVLVWSVALGCVFCSKDNYGHLCVEIPGILYAPWLTINAPVWMLIYERYIIKELLCNYPTIS